MPERLKGNQEDLQTPEHRTEAFFRQDVGELANALKGRVIISQDTGKRVRVDKPEAWPINKVGDRYTKGKNLRLEDMTPGILGAFPMRQIRQSIISAVEFGELGACVRLLRASKYDSETGEFVEMQREGEIAEYFEFESHEAVQLRFIDDSEYLYFNRGNSTDSAYIQNPNNNFDGVQRANHYLKELVG